MNVQKGYEKVSGGLFLIASRSLSENRILRLTAFKEAEADGKCTDARHPSLSKR